MAERQHVMTLTKNSMHPLQLGETGPSLRPLVSEDFPEDGSRLPKKTWYADVDGRPEWDEDEAAVWWPDEASWEDAAYWSDWTSPTSSWSEDYNMAITA